MKTQEQLSKMTDQELTFELAFLVFGDDNVYMANFGKVSVSNNVDIGYVSINDWSWIMPLAVEHKFSIGAAIADEWYCDEAVDATPQRAIAICLILKLQEIQA